MPYPNMPALIRSWIPPHLPAGAILAEAPPTRVVPNLAVVMVAGLPSPGDRRLTIDVSDIAVDCYANSTDAAIGLARQIQSVLRLRLPATSHGDAFIKHVATFVGPAPLPYEVTAIFRCGATYRVTTHANP